MKVKIIGIHIIIRAMELFFKHSCILRDVCDKLDEKNRLILHRRTDESSIFSFLFSEVLWSFNVQLGQANCTKNKDASNLYF